MDIAYSLDQLVSTRKTENIPIGEPNLKEAMNSIKKNIKDAGNTVDKYYKVGKWVGHYPDAFVIDIQFPFTA